MRKERSSRPTARTRSRESEKRSRSRYDFYAAVLGAAGVLGRALLDPARGVALVYATSMRNLSIALAIVVAADAVPSAAVLPIALAYVIQPPLGAGYMHYRRDVVDEGMTLREAVAEIV